jgi:hypothetical protein
MPESFAHKKLEERLALLEADNAKYREELEAVRMREKCEKLLRDNSREVNERRVAALANMPDDDSRAALLEEWPRTEPVTPPQSKRKPLFSAPLTEQRTGPEYRFPASNKDFIASLR